MSAKAIGSDSRPVRIMRALADAPSGLSTAELVDLLAKNLPNRQQTLSWYGCILRRHESAGRLRREGTKPGAYHNAPSTVYVITETGRQWLEYHEQAAARAAATAEEAPRRAAAEREAAAVRVAVLAEARAAHGPESLRHERREVAQLLRGAGCTLEDIASIFGVSREMIRLDLMAERSRRPESGHGSEPSEAVYRLFGERVKRLRAAQGLTLREAALKAGIATSTMHRAENGRNIALGSAVQLAEALGRDLSVMLAPAECGKCLDQPPAGFACRACGAEGPES